MPKLIPKADPLVAKLAQATHHKSSSKKKKGIPLYILKAWRVIYRNFTVRHKKLKQGPLKLAYDLLNDWMEGQS